MKLLSPRLRPPHRQNPLLSAEKLLKVTFPAKSLQKLLTALLLQVKDLCYDTLSYFCHHQPDDWFIKDNLEAEGAEVFVIDTANDFAELASRIEDVVSSGTDGIVLVSADPNQVANQLTEAFDADIPVFGCDSGFIEGMQVNATSDNYQMGELIVRYLFDDLMGKKGTVIALTHRPHPGVVKRCEALMTLSKNIRILTDHRTACTG